MAWIIRFNLLSFLSRRTRRNTMRNRRQFLKDAAGVSAGMFFLGSGARGLPEQAPTQQEGAVKRREIRIGQRRVKTVDVHSHIALPEAADVLKGTALEKLAAGGPTRPGTNRSEERRVGKECRSR